MRYANPSPYEELSHTADVGIVARGASPAEACARAALAMAQLQSGGGSVDAAVERGLHAEGEDRASLLVDFCRKVLDYFYGERLLLAAVEVDALDETRIDARGWFGRFDPERHAEGVDLKAVTYARAAVEQDDGGWRATLIFDI